MNALNVMQKWINKTSQHIIIIILSPFKEKQNFVNEIRKLNSMINACLEIKDLVHSYKYRTKWWKNNTLLAWKLFNMSHQPLNIYVNTFKSLFTDVIHTFAHVGFEVHSNTYSKITNMGPVGIFIWLFCFFLHVSVHVSVHVIGIPFKGNNSASA